MKPKTPAAQVWATYEQCKDYDNILGLGAKVSENERFYRGVQWDGAGGASLPKPVNPEDIPKEVWDEVARGISLPHAYALFLTLSATAGGDGDFTGADATNAENDRRAAVISASSGEIPAFTREEVEKMTPDKVKGNYKKILSSMKKWKF